MRYKIINRKKRYATIVADWIGTALFAPARLFRSRHEPIQPDSIRDILIIRTAYIGDVVMTLPVLKPLKEKFPQARISFLVPQGARGVLLNNPYLDEVFCYDPFWFYQTSKKDYLPFIRSLRQRRFDLVIEARGDIRELLGIVWPLKARYKVSYDVGGGGYLLTHVVPYPGLRHKVEYHLDMARYLGCQTDGISWGVYLTDAEKTHIIQMLRDNGIPASFICVHPGSRLPLKMWAAEKYAIVCDRLMEEYGMPVIILGAPSERPLIDDITGKMKQTPVVLAGRVSIRELAGILSRSVLFVCNDSAPMHIAASMKTPTVALFGPSKSIETGPYNTVSRVVEKDFPCRYTCDENTCTFTRKNACMTEITVEDVLKAAREIMKEKKT